MGQVEYLVDRIRVLRAEQGKLFSPDVAISRASGIATAELESMGREPEQAAHDVFQANSLIRRQDEARKLKKGRR